MGAVVNLVTLATGPHLLFMAQHDGGPPAMSLGWTFPIRTRDQGPDMIVGPSPVEINLASLSHLIRSLLLNSLFRYSLATNPLALAVSFPRAASHSRALTRTTTRPLVRHWPHASFDRRPLPANVGNGTRCQLQLHGNP
jgi:hypothetical protein